MFGVFINCLTVIIGSLSGMTFRRLIPKKITEGIMIGIGLCTIYIGIDGALSGENTLVLILSMSIGAAIGYAIDIDGKINLLSEKITGLFSKSGNNANAAQGFVTASLIFCVGSMTIVGAIQAGISGDNTLLITKSVLDLISALALSASFGYGVLLSAVFVLFFQGGIVLLSGLAGPFLSLSMQNEMICAGSVMIIVLGLNIIGVSKIKVANYLPAIIIAPMITPILNKFVEII